MLICNIKKNVVNKTSLPKEDYNKEITSNLKLLADFDKLTSSRLLKINYKSPVKSISSIKKSKPLVSYVININISKSNTVISVTDKNGNLKGYYTSGIFGFKGSQKTKKYTLITLLKNFIYNFNFLNNKSVIINFKGITRDQKLFIKKLKEKVTIALINYNNLLPHNGCRPRKMRRK